MRPLNGPYKHSKLSIKFYRHVEFYNYLKNCPFIINDTILEILELIFYHHNSRIEIS